MTIWTSALDSATPHRTASHRHRTGNAWPFPRMTKVPPTSPNRYIRACQTSFTQTGCNTTSDRPQKHVLNPPRYHQNRTHRCRPTAFPNGHRNSPYLMRLLCEHLRSYHYGRGGGKVGDKALLRGGAPTYHVARCQSWKVLLKSKRKGSPPCLPDTRKTPKSSWESR